MHVETSYFFLKSFKKRDVGSVFYFWKSQNTSSYNCLNFQLMYFGKLYFFGKLLIVLENNCTSAVLRLPVFISGLSFPQISLRERGDKQQWAELSPLHREAGEKSITATVSSSLPQCLVLFQKIHTAVRQQTESRWGLTCTENAPLFHTKLAICKKGCLKMLPLTSCVSAS